MVMMVAIIEVDDMFDELLVENNRLINELFIANKSLNLLNELIDHLNFVHKKYEDTIVTKDYKQWQRLQQSVDKLMVRDFKKNMTQNYLKTTVENVVKTNLNEDIRQAFKNIIDGNNNNNNNNKSQTTTSLTTCPTTSTTITAVPNLKTTSTIQIVSNVKIIDTKTTAAATAKEVSIDLSQSDDISDDSDCCANDAKDDDNSGHSFATESEDHNTKHCESETTTTKSNDNTRITDESDVNWLALLKNDTMDSASGQFMCPKQPDCQSMFATRKAVYQHCYYYHRLSGPFKCDYENCDKSFALIGHICRHFRQHAFRATAKYDCPYSGCTKWYRWRKRLTEHIRLQHRTDQPPLVCEHPDCGKRFITKWQLKCHSVVHSANRKTYPCGQCDKVLYSERTLDEHKRILHSLAKTFKCDIHGCDEWFRNVFHRRQHKMAVHQIKYTPKKRYVHDFPCHWPGCDYRGRSKVLLDYHTTGHTGERRFVCEWHDCGKRFRSKREYSIHYNYHLNVKPYGCQWPGCEYRATCYGNIVNHTKCVHKKYVSRL
ncbi:zinc finger protein-like [Oppia nitens]|uniref:zinc finger protein-like n=1 Tax=Oppia nitens TaxID=1686743 RepID=UPI0023DCB511|nr:zinc finger protein-like [Oppia nitens]